MVDFRTLDDLEAGGKTVLVRVDLNVPVEGGKISDFTRIDRILPTLKELADKGAKVLLLSHFGRPKGKVVPEMSLRPIADGLAAHLKRPVTFIDDCIGPAVTAAVASAKAGDILLAENVRFHAGEETNDPDFAKALAAAGDVYVNDAFSCSHRAHASTEAIARLLPAYAGRNMEAELTALTKALEKPVRPVMAIVGGAKISSKLDLLFNLIEKVDVLVIGGGMANTFLNAKGVNVGASLCEHDLAGTANEILAKAEKVGCDILLPSHVVLAREFKAGAANRAANVNDVKGDEMILDVGPESVTLLQERLATIKTLIWNGPLGAFEIDPFGDGTIAVAREVEKRTKASTLVSVAGGGDTVSALAKAGVTDGLSYISTAGGAFLEWMEGKTLPGVAALAR
ncbi:phosphoglycerate kinase [Sneathiella chungangensis]|uniref:Phosphoglycerate kinase n=1 Tax=Sneathiella chungangensis TaxID=1418234 RepID=A0A845MDN1_9PROT|nr:phosphoglycerate kinase [Sneathiella chungangensis]MZR22088.1 phosphoglycerate kinase [Sneathiella chungangensis]